MPNPRSERLLKLFAFEPITNAELRSSVDMTINSTPAPPDENPVNCYQTGDITLTKVPTGYLLGRVLPKLGLAPSWQYVAVYTEYDDALRRARTLAEDAGTRALLHKQNDTYDPL